MSAELIVAITAGVFSLAAAGFTYRSGRQTDANTQQIELLKLEYDKAKLAAEKQQAMSKFSLITRQRQPVLASGKASGWSSAQPMRGGGSWF